MTLITEVQRATADLRDPGSFDHVGRDAGPSSLVAGRVLSELAAKDERIVAGTADLKYVTRLAVFEANFPERFLQFGISERSMLGAAAGLATMGLIPYMATFACFSGILGFENIRTDLAYPGLRVRVLATHAGISMGFFGTSHHAIEDVSALRAVPGLTILSPCDGPSTEVMLRATVDHDGPIYFRLGRGRERPLGGLAPPDFGIGRMLLRRSGSDVLIVATGSTVASALEAAESLAISGVSASVLDAYSLKPFDGDTVAEQAARHRAVLTVEEHNVSGGLGSLVREALYGRVSTPVHSLGLRDEYSLIGPPTHLYRYYGIDADGIAICARRSLDLDAGPEDGPLWTADDRRAVLAAIHAQPAAVGDNPHHE